MVYAGLYNKGDGTLQLLFKVDEPCEGGTWRFFATPSPVFNCLQSVFKPSSTVFPRPPMPARTHVRIWGILQSLIKIEDTPEDCKDTLRTPSSTLNKN
jgi:hypothetical protein